MLDLVTPLPGSRAADTAPAPAAGAEHEAARLAAVERYGVLDTKPEPAFDRITALAAELFNAPIAIIGFIGSDQVLFKSHHGLDATQASRGRDASVSVLAPWIRSEFKYGFHAGVPLDSPDEHEIGTLCVIDRRPRRIEDTQLHRLRALGGIVMDELGMRLAARHALAQADILKSEVDHRAMNGLQFVASLLQLQSRAVGSVEAAQQLTVAANRVLAVARVHRTFSVHEGAERVPVLAYLHKLCAELSGALASDIKVMGTEVDLPVAQILPIGLIVNELVTNAKKHGAEPIMVVLSSGMGGPHELSVLDEGEGLSEGVGAAEPAGDVGGGLGMRVVNALAAQLGGRISTRANPACRGACFTVTFPAV